MNIELEQTTIARVKASPIKCLVSGQVNLENCMRHEDYYDDVDILCHQKMSPNLSRSVKNFRYSIYTDTIQALHTTVIQKSAFNFHSYEW